MPVTSVDDVARLLHEARSVVLVPGHGLARSRAHFAARSLADALARGGASVVWAVHPLAGRLPGHMNTLLSEAGVPYASQLDLAGSSAALASADVALLLGADDIVNPSLGFPALPVLSARSVISLRTDAPGFVGSANPLWPQVFTVHGHLADLLPALLSSRRR